MATFPYAFQKLMLATGGFVETAGTKTTMDLTKGQVAAVDWRTNKIKDLAPTTTFANTPAIYLAQGSMAKEDNLGGRTTLAVGAEKRLAFHGGYKESIKSPKIDPRHITRFYFVGATDRTFASIKVTVIGTQAMFNNNQSLNGGPHQTAPGQPGIAQDGSLRTQEVYRLRLDLKGSPVLRTLNRNEYQQYDATTKCMADGAIDRADLIKQWADGINNHPIDSLFVKATANGLVLTIEDIVRDTEFTDPTYSRNDYHERAGLEIFASVLDERNMQCNGELFKTEELTDAKQGTGFGETVLKELILENEYQQNPYHSDTRLREVLGDTNLTSIDRTRKYGAYFLLFSVPRRQNSTSQLDNDQYLYKFVTAPLAEGVMEGGTRNTAFEAFIEAYTESAGNPIKLEDFTSVIED